MHNNTISKLIPKNESSLIYGDKLVMNAFYKTKKVFQFIFDCFLKIFDVSALLEKKIGPSYGFIYDLIDNRIFAEELFITD